MKIVIFTVKKGIAKEFVLKEVDNANLVPRLGDCLRIDKKIYKVMINAFFNYDTMQCKIRVKQITTKLTKC